MMLMLPKQACWLYIGGEFSPLMMLREETYLLGVAADNSAIASSALD